MPALNKVDYDIDKEEYNTKKIVEINKARRLKEKEQASSGKSFELDYLVKIYGLLQKVANFNDKILQEESDNERIMELEEENARMKNKLKNSFPVHIICYSIICSAIMAVSGLLLILRFVLGVYTIDPYYIICALLISTTLFLTAIAAIKDWKDYLNEEGE